MVGKGNIKFLKIFLKGKITTYSVLFIWKIAFKTLVICEVESVFWDEMLLYDFRQLCQCQIMFNNYVTFLIFFFFLEKRWYFQITLISCLEILVCDSPIWTTERHFLIPIEYHKFSLNLEYNIIFNNSFQIVHY